MARLESDLHHQSKQGIVAILGRLGRICVRPDHGHVQPPQLLEPPDLMYEPEHGEDEDNPSEDVVP
jgi:hypothetical protein